MGMSAAGVRRVGVEEAADTLAAGGLVAHPTATVYGLGGRPGPALDREIARLKGRSAAIPLIRVAAVVEELRRELPGAWPPAAERLSQRFWPGPLTLVLPWPAGDRTRPSAGGERSAAESGVAVRVDPHPVLRALLERAGGWMTSTSLNLHGGEPATDADRAAEALRAMGPARVPLVLLDGGPLDPSPPSTIVSLVEDPPRILRVGAIPTGDVGRIVAAHDSNEAPS